MQMLKRTLFYYVILLAALMCLAGCMAQSGTQLSSSNTDSQSVTEETRDATVLTERQKQILEEVGLPTDYDALTMKQKSSIQAIEEMLRYLETKYDDSFSYEGYVASSNLEKEHLIVRPESYPHLGSVTVYRTYESGAFVYLDDYSSLLAKPMYENAVDHWLSQSLDQEQYIVFSDISFANQTVDEEHILSQASAATYVMIAQDACSEERLEAITNDYAAWLKEASAGQQSNVTILYLVSNEEFAGLNETNYMDRLPELRNSVHFSCSISVHGEPLIQKGGA